MFHQPERRGQGNRDGPRAKVCRGLLLLTWLVGGLSPGSSAGAEPVEIEPRVNYVYATQFGFGGYKVGGLRTDVYSLPIGFAIDDVIAETWDLQIGLPITYGRFRFSDGIDRDGQNAFIRASTNTIAIEPKLQLDIPIPAIPGLRLSPLGAFGFGSTFSTDASVELNGQRIGLDTDENGFYTYQVGLSSVFRYPWNDFTFLLGNAFIYAGDASFTDGEDDAVEGYGTFRTGVEGRHPLGFQIGEIVPDAGVFFVYNLFTPSLEFTRTERQTLEIDQIFEIGGTIGLAQPYEISWAPEMLNDALDEFRLGVGYQGGKDLDGVRLTFGFPF